MSVCRVWSSKCNVRQPVRRGLRTAWRRRFLPSWRCRIRALRWRSPGGGFNNLRLRLGDFAGQKKCLPLRSFERAVRCSGALPSFRPAWIFQRAGIRFLPVWRRRSKVAMTASRSAPTFRFCEAIMSSRCCARNGRNSSSNQRSHNAASLAENANRVNRRFDSQLRAQIRLHVLDHSVAIAPRQTDLLC